VIPERRPFKPGNGISEGESGEATFPGYNAERMGSLHHLFRLDSLVGGKGDEQGFVAHQVLHDGGEEAGFSGRVADMAGVNARKRQEALEPVRLLGEEAQRPAGQILGKFRRLCT
jgi:hypothetical protein